MGYIFSYYAIACSWSLTVVNFFIVGFNLPLDDYCKSRWPGVTDGRSSIMGRDPGLYSLVYRIV
jgi:hypothetical protein